MGREVFMKVLVVEDEWIVARDLSDLMNRFGHTVVGVAANATDALRLAAAEKPDLILMDIQLEGVMDGSATATEIVRRHAIPVVPERCLSPGLEAGGLTHERDSGRSV